MVDGGSRVTDGLSLQDPNHESARGALLRKSGTATWAGPRVPQGRDVNSRWPLYASVAVLGCECIACFFGGSSEWGESTNPARYRIDSGEAAEQARFAIELY